MSGEYGRRKVPQVPRGSTPSTGSRNIRIGAAVAEIEGLYTALRSAGQGGHRDRLLTELAQAGRRLTELALSQPSDRTVMVPSRSRWRRRRVLAAKGAGWIAARTSRRTG
ncbi:hypothetical protein ACFY2W_02035 [Streptomyces sp. NPDC001262]|uniref:hypothetical protein n=1 Tax=Streptomyces TaxID=1883 RepID=UPI0036CF8028